MTLALQVLFQLPVKKMIKLNPKTEEQYYYFYPYVNGRERGICIVKNDSQYKLGECKTVVFSEHRSSDSLIVICGKAKNFDIWDNRTCICISDSFWKKNLLIFSDVKKGIAKIKKELDIK